MGYTAIIDYGAGNLMSVQNALNYLGIDNKIASDPDSIKNSDRIILPGVGAFPAAMNCLKNSGLTDLIKAQAEEKPFLGICLGMQMLFEKGYEIEECEGLGLIPGFVKKIDTDLKLPHIGWNSLEIKRDCKLFNGINDGSYVYFVHSFCAVATSEQNLNATADYGEHVAAVVSSGNIYGCQFHPEKSGEVGLRMLKNFCMI